MGGWKAAKALLKGHRRFKGDERILGDSDFVLKVLAESEEQSKRRYRLAARGIDVEALARQVAELFELEPDQIFAPGRYPEVVQARSLLCYWAVHELGVTGTALARKIGLTQPAISISVKRGEKIAQEKGFQSGDNL